MYSDCLCGAMRATLSTKDDDEFDLPNVKKLISTSNGIRVIRNDNAMTKESHFTGAKIVKVVD